MFHRSWICSVRCLKLTILDLIAWLLCYLHPNVVSEIILQANEIKPPYALVCFRQPGMNGALKQQQLLLCPLENL